MSQRVEQYVEDKKQQAVEAAREMMRLLPHINTHPELGGVPMYKWQWDFFNSTNRMLLLTAANQIGKSSIQIRKDIHWATEKNLWPELWPDSYYNVAQFWYLYPTLDVATIEFHKKWVPEWLPRGKMKDDPKYGWEAEFKAKKIHAIHYKSGVSQYFKTYSQHAQDLQTGTVHKISTDEELPVPLYDELKFRTSATNGHFSMAFTATLGQYEWECAMEKQGTPEELFPKAKKIQVSLYDCLKYTNKEGKELNIKTPWDEEKIQERIDYCSSKEEIQKRIYGRFVKSGGLKYAKFLNEENIIENWAFNENYHIYAAVDPGSGGKDGHPSGIVFLAVSPNFDEGVVFLAWRGDGIPTTAGDTVNKFVELQGKLRCATKWYDYHSKDFFVLADQIGEKFEKAEKSHDIGEPILKTLLKFKAIKFVTGKVYGLEKFMTETQEGQVEKLLHELRGLREDLDKRQAKDDLIDPTRYICAKIPWDMETILKKRLDGLVPKKKEFAVLPKTTAEIIKERRDMMMGDKSDELNADFEQEIDFWNDCY